SLAAPTVSGRPVQRPPGRRPMPRPPPRRSLSTRPNSISPRPAIRVSERSEAKYTDFDRQKRPSRPVRVAQKQYVPRDIMKIGANSGSRLKILGRKESFLAVSSFPVGRPARDALWQLAPPGAPAGTRVSLTGQDRRLTGPFADLQDGGFP